MAGGGPKVRKDGPIAGLIFDVVALEYCAPFVLAALVILGQFVVLLDHDPENESDVDFLALPLRTATDFGPFLNSLFVPHAELTVRAADTTESVPLVLHSRFCLRVDLKLSRLDWPSNAGIKETHRGEFVPVLALGRCGTRHAWGCIVLRLSRSGVNPSVRRLA